MLSFSDCQSIIELRIAQLPAYKKQPSQLYEPIQYILSLGGKRIRPVATLLACNLFSDDVSKAVNPALALEVFHNFTLLHDDIMDNAPVRRSQPTVHEKWNDNVAILSGDAMQILAYELMCQAETNHLKALLALFNQTALEVCEGQQFDMNFATRTDVSLKEYMRMIELKTSVLLAACMKSGAICGNATDADADKMYAFGLNLGLAFQIQDDYLDVYADQSVFGKRTGGDISENKKTFLLIKALELAHNERGETLSKALNNQFNSESEKIAEVTRVYNELCIPEITRQHITHYSDKAFACLESISVEKSKKEALHAMATQLMNRQK